MEEVSKSAQLKEALRRLRTGELTVEAYTREVDAIYGRQSEPAPAVQADVFGGSNTFHPVAGRQKERLLGVLRDGAWHDTSEILDKVYGDLHRGTARIGARVSDLKADGHVIESRRKSGSVWEYRIVGTRTFGA